MKGETEDFPPLLAAQLVVCAAMIFYMRFGAPRDAWTAEPLLLATLTAMLITAMFDGYRRPPAQ